MSDADQSGPRPGEFVSPLESVRMGKSALSVVSLSEADAADKAFWACQTPLARLEALELMRQIVYGYDPVNARIERVIEVVELKPR